MPYALHFIPYATYDLMPYDNYASTSILCPIHLQPPGQLVCYNNLTTLPLWTSEDLTNPTSGATPMSYHLRNLNIHNPWCYTHHLYNHLRLWSLVCYDERANSKPPTIMSTLTFAKPDTPVICHLDVWPSESSIMKSCPNFIPTLNPGSSANQVSSVLWTIPL